MPAGQTSNRGRTPEQFIADMTSPRAKRMFFIALAVVLTGVGIGAFAPAPRAVDPEGQVRYEGKLMQAQTVEGYMEAEDDLMHEQRSVSDAKVWFWRFRGEHKKRVRAREAVRDKALARFNVKRDERNAIIAAAKKEVGIWSQYAVDETREQFWQTFQEGKDMGKRMTFYDMLFSMFDRRDENAGAFMAKWAIRIVMNYTMGMVVAVVRFLFQLGSIVWSYSPNALSGTLFFAVAAFSALSIIGAFLLLMYASCVGCCLFMAKNGQQRQRRGYQQQPRYISGRGQFGGQQRTPHYD
jgi:hypothetical protein